LRRTYPRSEFAFVNAAIGGTDSTYGAFRLKAHALDKASVDLLFVEFAVNDAGDKEASVRAMEGIVRRTMRTGPTTELCLLYTANETGVARFAEGGVPANIVHHEMVAERYGLPSVCLARAVARIIGAGDMRWSDFSRDSVHPNDRGHRLYADYLEAFLSRVLTKTGDDNGGTEAADLPPPLDPFCYERGELAIPNGSVHAPGWRELPGWSADRVCNWKPPADIVLGDEPGAPLVLRFDGTAAGIAFLAGMDTGSIEVAVDEGPYRTVELFDRYCTQFYRPKAVVLADGLPPGSHTLAIRISENKHADSTGRSLRLLYGMVNGSFLGWE
jgi:sialidase-1